MLQRKTNKILLSHPAPPSWVQELFVMSNEKQAREFSRHFIIPHRRLTMPQIMNLESPCLTCLRSFKECPDRKENIVICVGDYESMFRRWNIKRYGHNEAIDAMVFSMDTIATAFINLNDAAEKAKRAFLNVNLGEPYDRKDPNDTNRT